MRIETLLLERFGHFEDFELEFGDAPRLHVVFGPNEAGKSTLLAAIGDLLFGMPAQTPYNFRYPYGALRIGARVVSGAGATLAFKRRKAKTLSGTLLTPGKAEAPLPDDALAPFLGGADRSLFERMFGLDHQRLREAGQRMIRSDGDLGQAILEAGSGIDSLNRVLGDLAIEVDGIGNPNQKASTRPLWRSVEDFNAARRDGRTDALKVDEVRAAERRVAAASQGRERVAAELAEVRRRKGRLERMRRSGPVIADLDRLLAELEDMAEVPDLPPTFEAEWVEIDKAVVTKRHALEVAEARLDKARSEMGASPVAVAYAPHEAAIGEIREGLGRYRKDVGDELALTRDVAIAEEAIAMRLRALGHDPERALREDDPRSLMPTAAEMARAREVVRAAVDAAARREELGRSLGVAERELDAARLALAGCDAAVDPSAAAAVLDEALGLGDVEATALAARVAAEGARREADEAIARLPGWRRDGDALAACPFPDHVAVAGLVATLDEVAAGRAAAVGRVDEGRRALVDVRSRLAGLRAGGEVPTTEAIAATRERREERWRVIRDAYVDATRPEARLDAVTAGARAAEFEMAVRRADELVDRREADARRVATAAELMASEVAWQGRLEIDEQALARAQADERSALEAWSDLWTPSGHAPSASSASSWLKSKDDALRALAAARAASEGSERSDALATRSRALGTRAAELLGLEAVGAVEEDRHARMGRLRAAVEDRRNSWTRARAAAEEVSRCASRRDEAEAALTDLARAEAARRDDWSALAPRLGWRRDASVAEAEAVLSNWDGLAMPLAERETARRRLAAVREDNRSFRARVAELWRALAAAVDERGAGTGDPPEAIVRRLEEGHEAERAALAREAQAKRGVEAAELELEEAREAVAAAGAVSTAFLGRHDLSPETDCVSVGQRATAARELRAAVGRRRVELMDAGEGLGEATLREEAATTPPETVAAEVAALVEREDALVEAGQSAAQEASSADVALAQVRSRVGGVGAQARERTAALAFAGQAERWLVLATAQELMSRAIERYQASNQHPMVTRAGELMAELTRGHANPIEQLKAEYRDRKKPTLLGIRRDGSPCEIANMTEGTRDQLFLGLRIAAVERYAQAREPLPFVADDLFITSDDERTERGLRALAALARTTQVILFTHHLSVLRSAEGLAKTHGVMTHVLPWRHAAGAAEIPS